MSKRRVAITFIAETDLSDSEVDRISVAKIDLSIMAVDHRGHENGMVYGRILEGEIRSVDELPTLPRGAVSLDPDTEARR